MFFRKLVLAGGLMLLGTGSLQAQVIGNPPNGGNCFPFGCGAGSRYQQVYAASNFTGITNIGLIRFFQTNSPGGDLNSGTFTFSLSTSVNGVNALDATMGNNVGGDNAVFGAFVLPGGAAPAVLSFSGTSFMYDPTGGDLLLDIQITGLSNGASGSFYDARNNNAAGLFSRMHDFGSGFDDYGLVTEFGPASVVPEPASVALMAAGLLGLGGVAVRRRRKTLV